MKTQEQVEQMFAAAARETDPWKKAALFRDARQALQTVDAGLSPGDKHRRKLVAPGADKQSAAQSISGLDTVEQRFEKLWKACTDEAVRIAARGKRTLAAKVAFLAKALGLQYDPHDLEGFNR